MKSLAAFALLACLAPTPSGAAAGEAAEYALKASYLYHIAAYVDWPEGQFGSPQAAFRLCVAGGDPFGPALEGAVRGRRIAGRDIELVRLGDGAPTAGCHLLFVAGGSAFLARTLAAARGNPVLTVTEVGEAAQAAGIVNFVIRDQRLQFAIDPAAAAESRLAISSKLLALATNLRQKAGR